MLRERSGKLFLFLIAFIILGINGCQSTFQEMSVEERCDQWLELRETCAPKESNNPYEMLQESAKCMKEIDKKAGIDILNEQEKKEFTEYCNKKVQEMVGELLANLTGNEEIKQRLAEQNKGIEEYQKKQSPVCKKYLASIKPFCPSAIEVDPSYMSFEDPPKEFGPFGEILKQSGAGEKESCSWRVDIGADPMSAQAYVEGNSLVISVTVYLSEQEAAKQFSIMATQKQGINNLESCDGEVEKDFFYSSCSHTLTSPNEYGKVMKSIQMQRRKGNLIIDSYLNFAEGMESVCSLAQLKQLVNSI